MPAKGSAGSGPPESWFPYTWKLPIFFQAPSDSGRVPVMLLATANLYCLCCSVGTWETTCAEERNAHVVDHRTFFHKGRETYAHTNIWIGNWIYI